MQTINYNKVKLCWKNMQYELNFIVINYCLHFHCEFIFAAEEDSKFRSTNARFH